MGNQPTSLLQLILEQHLFKLHRSTYMQIFYDSKHYSFKHYYTILGC